MTVLVNVTGSYKQPGGAASTGVVYFQPRPSSYIDESLAEIVTNRLAVTLDSAGAFNVTLQATDDPLISPTGWTYQVTEQITGVAGRSYDIAVPSSASGSGLKMATVAPVPTASGSAAPPIPGPMESVIMGPATGIFTNIVGTYIIPPAATIIMFECLSGGGGGAAGYNGPTTTVGGGGGGGGGGRTVKWVSAAALRTQYPTGIPYTVGYGGPGAAKNVTYSTQGANGLTGGFTFVGDFIVATPGNYYGQALGGAGGTTACFGGSAGLGDTQGAVGGTGGVQWQFYLLGTPVIDGTGGNGGYPGFLLGGGQTIYVAQVQAAGGGGGGGGGGGILSGVAYNGGSSGFAITSNPIPIMGSGGIVGGAQPTAAGLAAGVTVTNQGGGGGGAACDVSSGDAQAGADAPRGSGSGGGGGGAGNDTSGGAGGNGGSGFLRIVAY